MAIVDLSIEIPDEIELGEVHRLYFEVVSEAIKTFVAKNHDYCSSWRLYDPQSIVKELLVRCVRMLKLLELEKSGQTSLVAEGIEAEFRDSLNWCVFGVLLQRGNGLDLLGTLSNLDMNFDELSKLSEDNPYEDNTEYEEIQEADPSELQDVIAQIIDMQLNSNDPFPMLLTYDNDHIIATQKSFPMGQSPFHYVRSDLMYPDQIEDFEQKYPGKVVFIRQSNLHDVSSVNEVLEEKQSENYISVEDIKKLMSNLK